MLTFQQKPHDTALDEAIDEVLEDLKSRLSSDTEEYAAATDNLIKLMKLKKELNPSWRPSPDAIIGVAGSLLSVVLILHFEKLGVVTSKALSFVAKLR